MLLQTLRQRTCLWEAHLGTLAGSVATGSTSCPITRLTGGAILCRCRGSIARLACCGGRVARLSGRGGRIARLAPCAVIRRRCYGTITRLSAAGSISCLTGCAIARLRCIFGSLPTCRPRMSLKENQASTAVDKINLATIRHTAILFV